MGQRLDLHTLLLSIVPNVYFQPPSNVQMAYPCVIYKRNFARTDHADNIPYRHEKQYQLTLVHKDPDTPLYDQIAALPRTSFEQYFTKNNLHHDVFTIFF